MDDTNGMVAMDLMITCALGGGKFGLGMRTGGTKCTSQNGSGGSRYVCGLFTSRVTRS
jgi:hypothetical protein